MGKGGKRWEKKPAQDESDSEISVEEGDIQALARSALKAGETILGAGQTADAPVESRGICFAPLLLQKCQDIEYKVPEGAKRVPWADTLCIDGHKEVPKDVKAKDGVKLESAFMDIANDAVKESYRRLKVMKVPCSRPTDFYAEMLRTDSQMFKVRERITEEQRRIKVVENRKAHQAAKKFAKNVRVKRLEDKAGEKRKTLDEIADWRKRSKDEKRNADDQDLDDILDKQGAKKKLRTDKPDGEKKRISDEEWNDPKKMAKRKEKGSLKQAAKDKKYGHGGKKKWSKSNDKSSTDECMVKGKGKGKKGKGGGKGGGKGFKKIKGGGKGKRR